MPHGQHLMVNLDCVYCRSYGRLLFLQRYFARLTNNWDLLEKLGYWRKFSKQSFQYFPSILKMKVSFSVSLGFYVASFNSCWRCWEAIWRPINTWRVNIEHLNVHESFLIHLNLTVKNFRKSKIPKGRKKFKLHKLRLKLNVNYNGSKTAS